jgi:hypothetical protein
MAHALKYDFDAPDSKKIRLIINTDAKNEADDQVAIVHALLTPKFCILRGWHITPQINIWVCSRPIPTLYGCL